MFEAVEHHLFLSLSWHPVPGRFYCPVCISQSKPPSAPGWGRRLDVANHLGSTHGWPAAGQSDALGHKELIEALMEWRRELEEIADGFEKSLLLVRGVDDFVDECETGG